MKQHRSAGRPTTRKDKNGLPVPVRADRDRLLKWFFYYIPRPEFDEVMQLSGDERFYRLHDALHDPAYRNTTPMTLCRKFGISLQDRVPLRDRGLSGWLADTGSALDAARGTMVLSLQYISCIARYCS